jgi:hypothetical protein
MKKLGIFIDITNIYKTLNDRFGRKLDYKKYLDFLGEIGEPTCMFAYGVTFEGVSLSFEGVLKRLGFTTNIMQIPESKRKHFYEYRLDAQMGIDIVQTRAEYDLLVLGSSHINTQPIITWAGDNDIETLVFASGITTVGATQKIEIFQSLLEASEVNANAKNA